MQKHLERPSHARYWVIFFAITLGILAYIDRVAISIAKKPISDDLGFSNTQMGLVFGAFSLGYALFEIPGGWLGDKYGPRSILMKIVLWWSAFTAITGAAWNLASMMVIRFLFGAGEAGCFPNLTKAFTIWLPHYERVRAQGIMWTFARWGGAFTPMLVILIYKYMSWHMAFVLFGSFGIVWAAAFYYWYRDDPRTHKSVNAAELALMDGAATGSGGHGDVPWGKLVSSRSVVLLWIQYFCLSYPWYFFITWLPSYLTESRHLDLATMANYAKYPLLFGGFGSLFSGFIAARMALWTGSVKLARKVMACIGFLGACIFVLVTIHTGDAFWAMMALGTASFCNDLVMPGAWGACMDIGGKYAGTVSGSMNMMGNMAGFVAPSIGGILLDASGGDYSSFMYSMAAVYFIGFLCWPFIDSVTPLKQD
jgi:MFS family permease